MKKLFILATGVITLLACNKDKFKTEPQIEVESYNTKVVERFQDLVIQLNFTDKEGDLSGGTFTYMPRRLNRRPPPPPSTGYPAAVPVVIPPFPTNAQGEFELRLSWLDLHLSDAENDTLFLRFLVQDKAGNKSDTVNSDQIVVLRQ